MKAILVIPWTILALAPAPGAIAASAPLPEDPKSPFELTAEKIDGPLELPWRSLSPDPAFHGQWLVAGDLDGDGQAELVTARNEDQRVTAAAALKLDGSELWHWGKPHAGKPGLAYDVPVQIHDLDGDGREEVWLSPEGLILVLDGATGRELRRWALPAGLEVADCIVFADLQGSKRAREVIVKDRYRKLWAYSDDWKPLWEWEPKGQMTCHHPTPIDIDGNGREEILAGYTLLSSDGREIWTMAGGEALSRGHLDACEVMEAGKRPKDFRILATFCGANRLALIDGAGRTLWELPGHHFESVDAGRLRGDLAGKQIVVDIDHRPYGQGPVWLLDDRGKRLGSIVCGYGRHHRLIDYNGDGLDEILIGNALRLFDGWGRCLARFGPSGAFAGETGISEGNDPGPLASTGDLDGDGRPEIILHSPRSVLIYRGKGAAKVPGRKPGTGENFTLY